MGFTHLPIPDQCVPTIAESEVLSQQKRDWLAADENVLIHCMGGWVEAGCWPRKPRMATAMVC
jgi:hypothetical protein